MDFATCEVHIFPFNEDLWGASGEDFIASHSTDQGYRFKQEECHWMIVDTDNTENRIPIYIH